MKLFPNGKAVVPLALLTFFCVLCGQGAAAEAASCPNEAIREAQTSETLPLGTTYLPDCMALEMVSPPVKRLQTAVRPIFSVDGDRVAFSSAAALAGTPGLQSLLDYYVASRGSTGWNVSPTSPPASAAVTSGAENKGGPYAISSDLGSWLQLTSTQTQVAAGVGQIFHGGIDGSFLPLSPLLVPLDDSGHPRIVFDTVEAISTGSSADLSATVFKPRQASTSYLPGDPSTNRETVAGEDQDNYVAFQNGSDAPDLELLARDKDGNVYGGQCGTHLGGGARSNRGTGRINQGAISPDGSRIYFSARPAQPEGTECDLENPLRIFKRVETPAGPEISELVPGEPSSPGDDLYQGASTDGSKVFLTTTRALTPDDKDSGGKCSSVVGSSQGCDLYLYDSSKPPAERLTDVSAGDSGDPTPGEGADVLSSITAISTDGSHAYFVAQGVLTTAPNPEGDTALAGEPNLYLYERDAAHPSGRVAFVGTLAPDDGGELWGVEQSFVGGAYAAPMLGPDGEEGAGDGHILVLASHAALTADDTDGGFSDLFRYDAEAGTLERISKAAPGGSETPASDVGVGPISTAPNANPIGEGRWVSEDGETIGFGTSEPLSPDDEDGKVNAYLWKNGKLIGLPAAANEFSAELAPSVSIDGSEVGFATTDPLLPQDGDTASDVYIARVDGGFPNPAPLTSCDPLQEGACQGTVVPSRTAPAPATSSFSGPGNQRQAACAKPKVRRRGRCVKAHKHQTRKKKASHRREGGSK